MLGSVRYSFSQKFSVSAEAAFAWCTDYQANDHVLLGNRDAKRTVTWITPDTVLVKDTFPKGNGFVEKEKLVQIYPERWMWISTHISGPNKYSQFVYQIFAEDAGKSRLDFNALHVEHKENLTEQDLKLLAEEFRVGDSAIWRLFAQAIKNEHSK
jgi:hypothetical protein